MLLNSLLGISDDIGRWVGTLNKPLQAHPGLLHRLLFLEEKEKKLLLVEVQLFSNSQTPSYVVIIGNTK